jgi:serine phosphatase RsbU (regulator of sigma subunit)/Flp pilus assembly protein TadD
MARWFIVLILFPSWALAQDGLLQKAIDLQFNQPDSAIMLAKNVLEKQPDDKTLSNAYEVIGIANWVNGSYVEAIAAHKASLKLRLSIDYKEGIAYSKNNLGLNHQRLGDKTKAIEMFMESLEVARELDDKHLLGSILGNIGTLYEEQGEYPKALDFHSQALDIAQESKDQRLMANSLNNIALIYFNQKSYAKAENFANRCLKIRRSQKDPLGEAQALNLLGIVASQLNHFTQADSLFQIALLLYIDQANAWGQAMVYCNMGEDAYSNSQFERSIELCEQSLALSKTQKLEWELPACKCLAEAYSGMNEASFSNQYWERYVELKDSLHRKEMQNDVALFQQRFLNEKEQLRLETQLQYEQELSEAEIKRQQQLRNASIGIGMMALILFFLLFSNYRSKQKHNELLERQNSEISDQKELIEEKSKHITDSIRYAERLQDGILPKWDAFRVHFKNHHVFYKPKDIVSGDFYWLEESDGRVFIAVADCTGHGVPGAMVSMVGVQGLNKAVLEEGLIKASDILQRLSDHVEEVFEKSGGSVRDGMDIALCIIGRERKRVNYAGAHNSLLIATRNKLKNGIERESLNGLNLYEFKADRRSIGGYFDAGPFTDQEFDITLGDTLFLFSDGYADQFGGSKNKKIGSRKMREFLLEAASKDDLSKLDAQFKNWKAEHDQIDDVTVIGIRI